MTPPSYTLDGPGTLDLGDVLDTVSDFGAASLELVAWEFMLPESAVVNAWDEATRRGLLVPAGHCPETGEAMFSLTAG